MGGATTKEEREQSKKIQKRVRAALEQGPEEGRRAAYEEIEKEFTKEKKKYRCSKCHGTGHRASMRGINTCPYSSQTSPNKALDAQSNNTRKASIVDGR